MKSTIVILFLAVSLLISCDPPRQYYDVSAKLSASINDTSETIHLGDTLKFSVTIPDTLITDTGKLVTNYLQAANYSFNLRKIDFNDTSFRTIKGDALSVTNGSCDASAVVNFATNKKPFTTILNVVPPTKGLYYLEIRTQPGNIVVNNVNNHVGLLVNFNAENKHWYLIDPYDNGFPDVMNERSFNGYGCYCFRVN